MEAMAEAGAAQHKRREPQGSWLGGFGNGERGRNGLRSPNGSEGSAGADLALGAGIGSALAMTERC